MTFHNCKNKKKEKHKFKSFLIRNAMEIPHSIPSDKLFFLRKHALVWLLNSKNFV